MVLMVLMVSVGQMVSVGPMVLMVPMVSVDIMEGSTPREMRPAGSSRLAPGLGR